MSRHGWIALAACLLALAMLGAGGPGKVLAQDDAQALAAEAESLKAGLDDLREEYQALEAQLAGLSGEDSLVIQREISATLLSGFDEFEALGNILVKQRAEGIENPELDEYVTDILDRIPQVIEARLADHKSEIAELRSESQDANPEDLGIIEEKVTALELRLDNLLEINLRYIDLTEAIGKDVTVLRSRFSETLTQHIQLTAGRLRFSMTERDRFKSQADEYDTDVALRQRADAAQAAVDGAVASLDRTVRIMEELGLDVTEYRTLMVEATGELSRGLTDAKVAVSIVQGWYESARELVVKSGPKVLVQLLIFIAILFAFRLLAQIVRKGLTKAMDASSVQPSELLRKMLISVVGNLVMFFGLLVALSQLGISLGPLLAGVGVAGFIIGFALQDTLANFAAGIMILAYRPFDVGDMVEAGGVFGKVQKLSLVSATILTIDNQTLIVPNGKIWGDVIRNVTAQKERRVDLVFGISYGDDIPHAEKVLKSILAEHDKVLEDPEPMVKLHELADSSVNFIVRPWVKTDDYWDVYWDVTREVKMRFDREGIGIPFPQRDVHIYEERLADRTGGDTPG
jgi:small conductance mechanosensitive channel